MSSRRRSGATLAATLACLLLSASAAAQSAAPAGSATSPSAIACPAPAALPSPLPAGRADQGELTVFAAASLADAFDALQGPWMAAYPGSSLVFSFDASSALRAQVEQGAPADVLASADMRNAQTLVDGCLAPGPVTRFAGNHLVVVVPAGDPAAIGSPADLAREGVRVIAAAPEVPVSRYAAAALEALALQPGYPADFVAAVTANTVSEEDNVRAVLAKIEVGEGDAAIVYATDALTGENVEAVAIPEEANPVATYAAVAVADTDQPALAAAFLAFLTGPEAQALLAAEGFLPPAP